MSITTWDELAKNQEDGETIEQAIVRLIAEHMNDPEAHLGENQSLQSHRALEIIDHAVDSIVEDRIADGAVSSRTITSDQIVGKDMRTAADVGEETDGVKMTGTGIEAWEGGVKKVDIPVSGSPTFAGNISAGKFSNLRTTWHWTMSSVDGWVATLTGTGHFTTFGTALKLIGDANPYQVQSLIIGSDSAIPFDMTKNPLLEFGFKIPDAYKTDAFITWGTDSPYYNTSDNFFGFYFNPASMYVYAVWYKAGGDIDYNALTSIDPQENHLYRAEVSEDGMKIDYYVDNVLLHTATPDWTPTTSTSLVSIASMSDWYGVASIYIWNITAQQDL